MAEAAWEAYLEPPARRFFDACNEEEKEDSRAWASKKSDNRIRQHKLLTGPERMA